MSLFWLCSNYGKHLTHHVLANAIFTFLVGSRQLLFLGLLNYSQEQPKPHLEATNRKQCPQLRKLRHLPSSLKLPHTTTIYNAVPESIYRCHGYGCLQNHSRCIAPAVRSNQPQHPRKKMPANTLPAPTGLELKYVLLGVGTQNYTCLAGDVSNVPDTTRATGNLPYVVPARGILTNYSEALRPRHKTEQRPPRAMKDPCHPWPRALLLRVRHREARLISQG